MLTSFVFLEPNNKLTYLLWFKFIIIYDVFDAVRYVNINIKLHEKRKHPNEAFKELLKYLEKRSCFIKQNLFFRHILTETRYSLKWTERINKLNKM